MPVALIWLIAALALPGAEALTGDLFLLMLGGGALAAAGSSLVFDELWVRRGGVRGRVAPAAGVGPPGAATAFPVRHGPAGTGRRSWRARARWCSTGSPATRARSNSTARSGRRGRYNDNDVYEPGDHVTVMHIDGATAVVSKVV